MADRHRAASETIADEAGSVEPAILELEPEPEAEPQLEPLGLDDDKPIEFALPPPEAHLIWEDGPLAEADADADPEPAIELDPDAGLADRLSAARETAEAVKSADGRSRAALYRALSVAYDFAIAAQRCPEDYAELLEESGVKAQARAPMTPIVKLVFGIDYDKAR